MPIGPTPALTLIFFFYGLAFFSMGVAITLEIGHGTDARLKHALRPLAAFGLLHGANEWLEMFQSLGLLPLQQSSALAWESMRLAVLAFSFLSLGAFGASLIAPDERLRRVSLLVPLIQASIWGFGLFGMRGRFPATSELWQVADVWTRYVLALPSALIASAGLIAQQRVFRRAGLARFGRDSLWAAVAFAWYGLVGQTFTQASPLFPSTVINENLFLALFGFPVQLLRAVAAIAAAVFVMRFLRAFEVETQRQIAALQTSQLLTAQRREALRGEMLQRIVAAQEAERQRIARELHDETGQALTAIGLGLRGITTTMRMDSDKGMANIKQLEGLIDRSLDELQRLIADLRPSHLDDLGLPATLRWYAGEVENRSGINVTVEVNGPEVDLESSVKTAAFRIAQEALTNVVKHARASMAHISLHYSDDSVTLVVEDNGIGFSPAPRTEGNRRPWGLIGMEERAGLLGGQLRVDSQSGKGTRVEVSIPYGRKTEAKDDDTSAAGG
jgi:signal transduction histidine kinase